MNKHTTSPGRTDLVDEPLSNALPDSVPVPNPHTDEVLWVHPAFAPGIARRLAEGWTPAALAELKSLWNLDGIREVVRLTIHQSSTSPEGEERALETA